MAKLAIVALVGILCLNLSIFLVNDYIILPQVTYVTPILPDEITGQVDINGTLTPSPTYNTQGWDVFGGANKLWRLVTTLVAGIPFLLWDLGVPLAVQLVLDALYTFILGIFFIEVVTGRDILD